MAGFCLAPEAVNRFKAGLKSGAIDPAKLADMSSEERNAFFKDYVGEHGAKETNALFESKLLLKNQQRGMVTWAKTVAGLKPEVKRDLISRIQRLNQVLDPADKEQFLHDLAAQKLGVDVSQTEAKTIADLSKQVEQTRTAMEQGGNRLDYGRAVVALKNYVSELKTGAQRSTAAELKHPLSLLNRGASNAKAITASMDNSAIFRQGWKTLWTHPGVWQKNARQSFVNLVRQFGGKPVLDELEADIISRPTYDKMVTAKLAVANLEEAFPTTAPEKIPLLGRAYKASEAAYTAFVQKTRADVFDQYLKIAEKTGVNTNDPAELQAIGKLVNSLTGRGNLGRLEPVGNVVNNVFFSPRFLKSNFDTLTLHAGDKMTPFARKQAAMNLVKIVTSTAAVITLANAVRPGSVELDPRSSDFGKIRVGDTRFDVTGGIGSIMTLAARVATRSSKSTTTGLVNQLNTGAYGAQTTLDVVNNFLEGKLSPAAGLVRDLLKGQDFQGNKVTLKGEASNLLTPMSFQNFQQAASDPNAANALLTWIADGLGISANVYGPNGLNTSGTKVSQFQQSVGAKTFNQANNEYTAQLSQWELAVQRNKAFQRLPQATQQKIISKEKSKLQQAIFNKYGFTYKSAPKTPTPSPSNFTQ